MICEQSELELLLGLGSSITEEEQSVIALLHPACEAAVTSYLGYPPIQVRAVEYYPRAPKEVTRAIEGSWDTNEAHTQAQYELYSSALGELQLERLPIRQVHSVRVDYTGRFGQGDDAFDETTELAAGTDYWVDYDREYYSPSGIIYRSGSWPATVGSVRVDYTAGYSKIELAGKADSTSTSDTNGQVTTANVDASPIKNAVYLTLAKAMNQWNAYKKKTLSGWAGPLQSERLQDYSYSVAGGAIERFAGQKIALPSEAMELLEPYVNYGVMRT